MNLFPQPCVALALVMCCGLQRSLYPQTVSAPSSSVTNANSSGFPEIYNSETAAGDPLEPADSLAAISVPDGFDVKLFAAEPQVQNPIAACFDGRGRLWVAENYTYAEREDRFDLSLNDRVIVLEDRDGDGAADHRTVFTDQVKMLTGITVGLGGVWLMCPPQLLFIPDADGDLVADGPAQVKLDGFYVARENYHNFANGLSWGPDSWLYGRCGASCAGEMGLPGSADAERIPIRGGMWRYDPRTHVVEALTQGTTNPWGHDWNEYGDLFFINTVNGHLWHAIPGAHFVRPHTLDANPYSYELIDMHADHWHFDTGKSWTDSRDGAANDYGGGHAHIGMLIYQEPTWPEEYRGRLFTVNMHGRRINTELLEPAGSGYVGRHGDDFLLSADEWFRGMDIIPGPDGNAMLIDWYDTGECHEATGVHRTSGRIFKICYAGGSSKAATLQSAALPWDDPLQLANLQTSASEWLARRARERLRSMAWENSAAPAAGQIAPRFAAAVAKLSELLDSHSESPLRLRALFALNALDALQPQQLQDLLGDRDPHVRSWAIRLLTDNWAIDKCDGSQPVNRPAAAAQQNLVRRLEEVAVDEPSASVRLTLASTLQRLPLELRLPLATILAKRTEDGDDHNLPLMVWYGVMPLAEIPEYAGRLADLAAVCQLSTTRRLIARRLADRIEVDPAAVDELVTRALESNDQGLRHDLVRGIAQALAGRRQVPMPARWSQLSTQLSSVTELQSDVRGLNVLFGDGVAIEELKRNAADRQLSLEIRQAALESLVASRAEGLRELCIELLSQRFLNLTAAKGLARETDPAIGEQLVRRYRSFGPLDRPQVISILASRKEWAAALLQAVAAGDIERGEISPFQARQIASFNDQTLNDSLAEHWGQVRETPDERRQQIAALKELLTPAAIAQADVSAGRSLFTKSCSSCHKLFGQGGELGPDLTGSQRSNLDYLLENIVDPSAVVTKEFRATVVLLLDGRVLTGLVTSETENVVTLGTQNETYKISKQDIDTMKQSEASTMPDGLLSQLNEKQIVDLVAYLQSRQQVTLAD